MLQTKIVDKDTCAVAFEPTEILVRKRGKANYGTEKILVSLRDGKLYVSSEVAKRVWH